MGRHDATVGSESRSQLTGKWRWTSHYSVFKKHFDHLRKGSGEVLRNRRCCELMYYLAFSPLTNPINHPSRGMKSPLRRNKNPFTLHNKPESLYCLTQRGEISHSHCPYAGQISADYVCSSLYKRGNERRALTMGSTPTKENMESRFTLLLFSLHNERRADGDFYLTFLSGIPERRLICQQIQTLFSRGQEKRRRKG